jgi:hypothetical protein
MMLSSRADYNGPVAVAAFCAVEEELLSGDLYYYFGSVSVLVFPM